MDSETPYHMFGGIISGVVMTSVISNIALFYLIQLDYVIIIILKYIALIYMLYLAYKIWSSENIIVSNTGALTYYNGFFLNAINPKAYI
ncbi:MAG: hypothetical protein PVF17_13900 [Ignavibacteria bacterium]|jgi:threonine/homoserine/homoserine lactone efflux protein